MHLTRQIDVDKFVVIDDVILQLEFALTILDKEAATGVEDTTRKSA